MSQFQDGVRTSSHAEKCCHLARVHTQHLSTSSWSIVHSYLSCKFTEKQRRCKSDLADQRVFLHRPAWHLLQRRSYSSPAGCPGAHCLAHTTQLFLFFDVHSLFLFFLSFYLSACPCRLCFHVSRLALRLLISNKLELSWGYITSDIIQVKYPCNNATQFTAVSVTIYHHIKDDF